MPPREEKKSGTRPIFKGASVSYQRKTLFSFLSKPSDKRYPVVNMNRSEIEFRAVEALGKGQTLDMMLKFPGIGRPARLTAEVLESKPETRIGVESYNYRIRAKVLGLSPEAWEILKKIDQQSEQ